MSGKKLRIYLADDHQVLIDGMKAVLNTNPDFEIAGFSVNGLDIIDQAIKTRTDILVMDINMPEKDGIEVLKDYSTLDLPFKIIILSSYDNLKLIKEVMKLGARGYLTKQCAGENIIEAIYAVENNEEYYCKTVREKIMESFTTNKTDKNSRNHGLTERETEIIKLIAMEYSGKEIGEELSISSHTVETHRKNLIKKLEVKNTIGLVKFALKNNLINN